MALLSLRLAAWTACSVVLFSLVVLCRLAQVIYKTHRVRTTTATDVSNTPSSAALKGCRLAIFLGSGGHTGEMLRLLTALDFARYTPRTYIISSGDSLSLAKVSELEAARADLEDSESGRAKPAWTAKVIPRARKVHQSFWTAPITTVYSFGTCLQLFTLPSFLPGGTGARVDLILLNGPGSCVPIAIAAFLPRLIGLHSPQLIYIESLARVKSLSLSGKILRIFVDRFFVQWTGLSDLDEIKENNDGGDVDRARGHPHEKSKVPWWLAQKEYRGILV